jgi:hypothetical protein
MGKDGNKRKGEKEEETGKTEKKGRNGLERRER